MLDILLDSGQYAIENLAVPVAASLATLWANAKVTKRRAAAEDVADHDRRAAEINDDLRRWIHDRDREARVRMDEIRQDARAMGVASGGALTQSAGKVYRQVLHEYRDRGTLAQREFEPLLGAEGPTHSRWRERHARPAPELVLTEACRELLDCWRELAEADPSRSDFEPRLAALERPLLAA